MKVIESTRSVFCDIDDTLVIWDWQVLDPEGINLVYVGEGSNTVAVLPHLRHIELLKQFKARGHTVIVWSQGGQGWAKAVVEKLGIEEIVDIVMSKPSWYIDDLHASAFMGQNIYLHPNDPKQDQRTWIIKDQE